MIKTIEPYTPLQYIMGKAGFCGLDFVVDERVFIPRPETELVVTAALDAFYELRVTSYELRILDLCTGSGCIAIALMARLCSPSILSRVEGLTKHLPDCTIVASDASDDALAVARENARRHGLSDTIEFAQSDLFTGLHGSFDIIVSNPPYIARHEFGCGLEREVLKEPRAALDGGEDGLDFYRMIIPQAPRFLRHRGYLVMEIGYGQAPSIRKMIEGVKGLELITVSKDYNGIGRVVVARWISSS